MIQLGGLDVAVEENEVVDPGAKRLTRSHWQTAVRCAARTVPGEREEKYCVTTASVIEVQIACRRLVRHGKRPSASAVSEKWSQTWVMNR